VGPATVGVTREVARIKAGKVNLLCNYFVQFATIPDREELLQTQVTRLKQLKTPRINYQESEPCLPIPMN